MPSNEAEKKIQLPFLQGNGEMSRLTREYDWSGSPLGPPEQWPPSLTITLGILLNSAFPMFLFWGEDHICFYNDAYRPSLGMEGKHPALGKKGKEVWPEIWDIIGPLIYQVRETGQPVWFEDRLVPIYRNGSIEDVYWTFSYSPVYGENGHIEAVFVTCTETTEKVNTLRKLEENEAQLQKRVEENTREIINQKKLLDNILSNSSNGISVSRIVRDENGIPTDARTILANDAAVRFTGLPRELYLSKTARELDPAIMESEYGKACVRTLETGDPFILQYFLEPTGRWLELTVSRMDPDHLIHIFTDVTEIKKAQLQLENTVSELKRSNSSLEDFAYAASHDLKEPVRKMRFYSDYVRRMLDGRISGEERKYLDKMDAATARMSELINDLLSYSFVSMQKPVRAVVSLDEVLKQATEDLELEIQQRKARLHAESLGSVIGDRGQLRQVFFNLLSNALKYQQPDTPPEITIKSEPAVSAELPELSGQEPGRRFKAITFSDKGIGFRQSDAAKIFSVFTRLHNSEEYEGTGVGLSIVRKVAENHNGFVRAESSPGEGARFTVYLPE